MTKHLNLDDEQAAILLDAADTAVRFLGYRANRLDPDGVVSGAAKLQANKLQNIKDQLGRPAVTTLADLHPLHRQPFMAAIKVLAEAKDEHIREMAFTQIRAILLNPMHRDTPMKFEAKPDD